MNQTCNYCNESLKKDITKNFNASCVGRITCPHCKKKNKRYLSEADLLLYFIITSTTYSLVFLLFIFLLGKIHFILWILGIILVFVGMHQFMKNTGFLIYEKAYFKENWKNETLLEDSELIARKMNTQYLIFMLLALLATSIGYTGTAMILMAVVITFNILRFQRILKRERMNQL